MLFRILKWVYTGFAYQMEVNFRRTSNLYRNQPLKNGPKTKTKGSKQGVFEYK